MTGRRALLIVLAVAALFTACGVPEDDGPQELTAEEVPFGLLTVPPTTTTMPEDVPPSREAQLWFVNPEDLIEPVLREVGDRSAKTVVETLVETTSEDYPAGFNSAIPPDTRLLRAELDLDGVLTVDLSAEFNTVEGDRSILAVAQIVFTATGIPGVDAVRFRVEGEDVPVNDENSAQQTEPVTRLDYDSLVEP